MVDANMAGVYPDTPLYVAGAVRPLVVTFQEVCDSAYPSVTSYLHSWGYTIQRFEWVTSSGGTSNCAIGTRNFLLVASKGAHVKDEYVAKAFPAGAQADGEGAGRNVRRGYACLRTSYLLLSWISCSSHVHGTDVTAAIAQANYLRTADVLPGLPYRGKFIGVDMNRTSCQTGPALWYYAYREGDEARFSCANTDAASTTDRRKKIDYVWVNPSGLDALFGKTEKFPNRSDHHTVHAAFRWR